MSVSKLLLLITLMFLNPVLRAQDFMFSLEQVTKVEIVANTTVILKKHALNELLIPNQENIRSSGKDDDFDLRIEDGEDNTGFGVQINLEGDLLRVNGLRNRLGPDLVIYLPQDMYVAVEIPGNKDIYIYEFSAEIEARTHNGDILMENITGPIVVESNNGDMMINFKELNQSSPSSVITTNGNIEVQLPIKTRANLSLRTDEGKLKSDFDLGRIDYSKDKGRRSNRTIQTPINGGGVDLILHTSNGIVNLMKKKI